MELENVLLIGGSGFVGGWIASRLSERGIRVTIPTRHRDHTKKLTMLPMISMVEANVHDPQELVQLMRGQDAVINLVGILHDRDSRLPYGKGFAAAHVDLPGKIVTAMRQSGVRRLVHMSALKAATNAPSEYLRSKGEGEAIVHAAMPELDITVFRPSVIFGPDDVFLNMFAKLIKLFPILPLGAGEARFQRLFRRRGERFQRLSGQWRDFRQDLRTLRAKGLQPARAGRVHRPTGLQITEDHRPRERWLGVLAGWPDVAAAESAAVARQPALDGGR